MSDIIKITNLSCTYVEKLRNNNTFFKNEFLLSGVFYVNLYTYDIYKTLLNFSLPLVDVDNIKKISLNIFLNNIRVYNNMQANFKISTLTSPFMGYTANWNNRPEINNFNSLNFSVNPSDVGKYMELDITYIIKNTNNNFYGIALESSQEKYTSMLQFLSSNSVNPPYITIETVSNKVNTAPENTDKIVTNIPTEISKNLPSKNTLESNIEPSMLTSLKTSIDELNTKYSSLESIVKTTADSISIPSDSNATEELSSKILNLEEKLDIFNDNVNTLKLNYDILKNILNKNDETIASIVDHLAEIEVKLSSISDSSDFSPMINSLNNSVNTLKSSINEINLNNSSAIEKVNTRLNTLENPNISKFIEENITPLANSLSALQAQYETLKQQISLISITPLN
ncbi:DNRLRE domain-containing protein [uncultured Clostridium sp.]|uniref:DNRLRE domain-containing protein n=1 Tax=uncultured Clostridium sp. TaxID=59620 RepID=UPI002673F3CC|nr:DNRLRE domain-containing protein [uncultured Clostridium sp.]